MFSWTVFMGKIKDPPTAEVSSDCFLEAEPSFRLGCSDVFVSQSTLGPLLQSG